MDLIDEEPTGNAPEFTVSELSGAVKRVVEGSLIMSGFGERSVA